MDSTRNKSTPNADDTLPYIVEVCSLTKLIILRKNNGIKYLQYEEVSIPIPYGHLAAKWWGRQDVRPIVCLHGWQDNCGTFDTLIPLLPQHVGYLAIDLPGHGLSSYMPNGIVYSHMQYIHILDYVFREHFKWSKVSLLGHSMSGILSFVLASMFPHYVDMVISIDVLKPPDLSEMYARAMIHALNGNIIKTDVNNLAGIEPPSYSYEELIDKMVSSTGGSVNRESAPYLLQRGSKQSKLDPDRYYFSRDNRLKSINRILLPMDILLVLAQQIRCPYLFFRGEKSSYSEPEKNLVQVMETMQAANPLFEVFGVEATHHMHLTEPTMLKKHIERFLHQYRSSDEKDIVISKL